MSKKRTRAGKAVFVSKLTQVRRDNLRALVAKEGGPTALAKRLGHAGGPSYLSQLVNGKSPITEKVVRKIEQQLGLKEFTLDTLPGEAIPFAGTDHAMLAQCIRAVGDELERVNAKPGAKKLGELIAIVYEHSVETHGIDPEYIRKLVGLL